DVVAGNDVLGWNVHDDGAEADADHSIDGPENEDDARSLRRLEQFSQPENDSAFVFIQDLDGIQEPERDDDGDDEKGRDQHGYPPARIIRSFATCRLGL